MEGPELPERRDPDGRSTIQNGRLLARAVERGWISGRFQTHKHKSELINEIRDRGDITLAERATLGAFELIESKDERAKGIGIRSAIAMERINQVNELAEINRDPFVEVAAPAETPQAVQVVNVIMPDNGRGPLPEIHVNGIAANGMH